MKYPIPPRQVAEIVVRICEVNYLTPFGLLSQIRDIEENPRAYGSDLVCEQLLLELFEGTKLDSEDVTEVVCREASYLIRNIATSQITGDNDDDEETITVSFKRSK